jgi:hypothetical protein
MTAIPRELTEAPEHTRLAGVGTQRRAEPYGTDGRLREDRSESLHDLEGSSQRLTESSQCLRKSSQCLRESSPCLRESSQRLDEAAACLMILGEDRSKFGAVLEQSFHVLFERPSRLSESKG